MIARYAGTRLGRQELDAEIIDDRPGALWTRAGLEAGRVAAAPELARIVVAVDPPATSGRGADACGIVAAGRAGQTAFVLADETAARLSPAAWAARAVALWRRLAADRIVAEVNQGGEMVAEIIRQAGADVPAVFRQAVAMLVAHWYENRGTAGFGDSLRRRRKAIAI